MDCRKSSGGHAPVCVHELTSIARSIIKLAYSFIHSFIYLFIHSFIYLFIHSSTQFTLTPSTKKSIRTSTHPFTHHFIHPSSHPSVRPSVFPSIHPSIRSSIKTVRVYTGCSHFISKSDRIAEFCQIYKNTDRSNYIQKTWQSFEPWLWSDSRDN